jgi:hypothetical protein
VLVLFLLFTLASCAAEAREGRAAPPTLPRASTTSTTVPPPTTTTTSPPPTTTSTVAKAATTRAPGTSRAPATAPPTAPPATTPRTVAADSSCHPSYVGTCLPVDASDVDCAGGPGNGPVYATAKRFQVVGPDVFDLDRDGDGIACES